MEMLDALVNALTPADEKHHIQQTILKNPWMLRKARLPLTRKAMAERILENEDILGRVEAGDVSRVNLQKLKFIIYKYAVVQKEKEECHNLNRIIPLMISLDSVRDTLEK